MFDNMNMFEKSFKQLLIEITNVKAESEKNTTKFESLLTLI